MPQEIERRLDLLIAARISSGISLDELYSLSQGLSLSEVAALCDKPSEIPK